jgi:hypothetical protein
MTRSRLLAGLVVLLLGVACGRLGAPVRRPPSQAVQPAAASEVQAPASPVDEEAEEKK